MPRLLPIVVRLLSWVLALLFLVVGRAKFTSPVWAALFVGWGYPDWFRLVVGAVEIASGLGLIFQRTRRYAGAALVLVMCGAAGTHIIHSQWVRVVVCTVLASLVAVVMRGPLMTVPVTSREESLERLG